MSARKSFAKHLAIAFLAGDWTPQAMKAAGHAALGNGTKRLTAKLVSEIHERSVTPYAPPPRKLARYILESSVFDRLHDRANQEAGAVASTMAPARMAPLPVFEGLPVPALATTGDLAAWLETSPARLEWFADAAGRLAQDTEETLRHYRYAWAAKRRGPPRLIEAPKADTKRIQRKILKEILDLVPAHDCAQGFIKGRSCMSNAQRHAGERVVVAVDLKDFFPRVPIDRVHGLFRCLGYPWAVARLLTGLCSTSTPPEIFEPAGSGRRGGATRYLFHKPHLPQGAPTSPALANLCSWRMDCRLNGLARHLNARYTRYADDLAFSGDGDLAGRVESLLESVTAIVKGEGQIPNDAKTRVMRQGQRQILTGLVINQHVNIPRSQFDALKATLHNCARFGPAGQNRDRHPDFRNHLNGRVTWVENVNSHEDQRKCHSPRQCHRA
jgi:hypothetical protein